MYPDISQLCTLRVKKSLPCPIHFGRKVPFLFFKYLTDQHLNGIQNQESRAMGDLPAFSLRASVLSGPEQVERRRSAGRRRKDEIRRASVAALANLDFSTGVSQSKFMVVSVFYCHFYCFLFVLIFTIIKQAQGRPVSQNFKNLFSTAKSLSHSQNFKHITHVLIRLWGNSHSYFAGGNARGYKPSGGKFGNN